FVSATDLHLKDALSNANLKAGNPNTGITTDIDGEQRDTTKPYIGADEIVCKMANPTVEVLEPVCPNPGKATIKNYDSGKSYTFSPQGPTVGINGEVLN